MGPRFTWRWYSAMRNDMLFFAWSLAFESGFQLRLLITYGFIGPILSKIKFARQSNLNEIRLVVSESKQARLQTRIFIHVCKECTEHRGRGVKWLVTIRAPQCQTRISADCKMYSITRSSSTRIIRAWWLIVNSVKFQKLLFVCDGCTWIFMSSR